jgi:large subunit ribosomal protein L6
MSKIGKLPITVPANVTVTIGEDLVTVKGPKGEMTAPLMGSLLTVEQTGGELLVGRKNETKEARAMHGLTRSLIQNCVTGVTEGFTRTLEINGVGYRAEAKGPNAINLFIGYSHPVEVPVTEGVEYKIDKNQVVLSGIDKQKVGQMAAVIRGHKKPEPYKGKGIKYLEETIRRKAGKAAKA